MPTQAWPPSLWLSFRFCWSPPHYSPRSHPSLPRPYPNREPSDQPCPLPRRSRALSRSLSLARPSRPTSRCSVPRRPDQGTACCSAWWSRILSRLPHPHRRPRRAQPPGHLLRPDREWALKHDPGQAAGILDVRPLHRRTPQPRRPLQDRRWVRPPRPFVGQYAPH
jgi:hypothetical protein